MKREEVRKQIESLRKEIEKHRVAYHVYDKPTISDEVYDSLMNKLINLEQEYPEFDSLNSPTKRIGGSPLEEFKKVKHSILQWSYDNVFDYFELKKWEERNLRILEKEGFKEKMEYFSELKIDGLKIVLTYTNQELTLAATRGDGEVGEDVTENIRTIKTIPLSLPPLRKGENITVVGEVWMSKTDFEKINKQRKLENLELYANPRNVAAGTLRQLDPRVVATRNLKFYAYDIPSLDIDQSKKNSLLKEMGFFVNDKSKLCKSLPDVQKFYEEWNGDKRFNQEYGIDGVVVKVNNFEACKLLGYTAKSPRFGIAYKFSAEEAVSKVLSVTFQVGRTGVVTPVAELEPVQLSGSTVKRATLHNFDEIRRLGVKIGDHVMVRKAGDIIPQVFDVLLNLRTGKEKNIKTLEYCPVCNTKLVKDEESDGVKILCPNDMCSEKIVWRIIYFVSKKCVNIEGLGEETVKLFYELGKIKNISDIYKLRYEDMEGLEGFKDKSINNILSSIQRSKNVSLERFITSLSINGIGEETAQDLAKVFKTFNTFRNAEQTDLQKIYGIGDRTIGEIVGWQKNTRIQREVDEILKYVDVKNFEDTTKSRNLENLRFVITGSFDEYPREEIERIIRENGGSTQSAVNAKTSYLIVGKDPGSKLEKAKKLEVSTISIDEFVKLIGKPAAK